MNAAFSLLTNKHVVIAMIVAPILAILAYLGTDAMVSEKPALPEVDESYPLVAHSNCRYESGLCELENGDLLITLRFDAERPALSLTSSHAIDAAFVQIGTEVQEPPTIMRPAQGETAESGKLWQLELASMPSEEELLRLVVVRKGSRFFVETGTAFSVYDNGFGVSKQR
ncbi:hypothetical protein [Allohahella marinimesophila]|uniref:Uncharacterized protein n=1 Tax=Allohahella marinimesophila TaxID=1054972 RepID=A0ABP7PCI3_9GAMM